MNSYYPSLVAGAVCYCVAGLVQRISLDLGHKRSCYPVIELLALLNVAMLFIHFCTRVTLDTLEFCFVCMSILVMVSNRIVVPSRLLWPLCLGIGLSILDNRLLTWYPFSTWHGVPTVYLAGLAWFSVSRSLFLTSAEGFVTLFIGFLGTFANFCVQFYNFSLVGLFEGEYGKLIFLCNQFWVAVALFTLSDVMAFTFRWIKYKTAKPSI